ncbi:MAG: hypothetical protein EOO81_06440 [Oxalobacteraceae bacterium]|nr:MAG: hypothetical protein EOO81_06440 [Oxalobacteraceae bacterium]
MIFITERWADFESDDAARHIQFQVAGLLVVIWYCFLTWRAWHRPVHGKLVVLFLSLLALSVLFFAFLPIYKHGVTPGSAPVFLGILLLSAIGIMFLAWRVAGAPNNSFKPNPHQGGA